MSPEGEKPTTEEMPPPPPDEPAETAGVTADDSVFADEPDTTTGKEHLMQNDEGRPGPGV